MNLYKLVFRHPIFLDVVSNRHYTMQEANEVLDKIAELQQNAYELDLPDGKGKRIKMDSAVLKECSIKLKKVN